MTTTHSCVRGYHNCHNELSSTLNIIRTRLKAYFLVRTFAILHITLLLLLFITNLYEILTHKFEQRYRDNDSGGEEDIYGGLEEG